MTFINALFDKNDLDLSFTFLHHSKNLFDLIILILIIIINSELNMEMVNKLIQNYSNLDTLYIQHN